MTTFRETSNPRYWQLLNDLGRAGHLPSAWGTNRFGVIYMDPPWPFKTYSKAKAIPCRTAEDPYPAMDLWEIAGLPIPTLAARDCALIMWVSDSLPDIPAMLARLWGFTLKTDNLFVWAKLPPFGMGYYTRKRAETCVLMTRGRPKRYARNVDQVISTPRREHSRKPDEAYERIEQLFGDVQRIELFARGKGRKGWTTWGDEAE